MKRSVLRYGLVWVALVATCLPGFAEVSTDVLPDGQVQIVVLGSTEGPDPFGMSWRPYRDIPAFRILNPYGDDRGDGRPDIAMPPEGQAVVSWAWNNGLDHDIAVAEWTADGWSAPLFLTSSALDDVDPRLAVTNGGSLHLIWWSRQDETIHITTRQNGSNVWAVPREVTTPGERGRRPTLVVRNDTVHVAFERDSAQPDVAQEVVIKKRYSDGSFGESAVLRTSRIDRLDPVLHLENGWMWMDWKQSGDQLAFVVNGPDGWSEPAHVAWPDPSWLGVEDARQQVRQFVMSQGEAPSLGAADRQGGDDPPRPSALISDEFGLGPVTAPTVWNGNQSSGNVEQKFKSDPPLP